MAINVGDEAPDFDLPTHLNARLSLKALRGKNVVRTGVEMYVEIDHRSICVRQMEPVFFRGVSPTAMDWTAVQMVVGISVVSVRSLFFV